MPVRAINCPLAQTNGKLERFHRTLAVGWPCARFHQSTRQRDTALPGWLHFYNITVSTTPSAASHHSPG